MVDGREEVHVQPAFLKGALADQQNARIDQGAHDRPARVDKPVVHDHFEIIEDLG
jgi:hypothetical protein